MGRVARAPTEEGRPNMAPHSTHVVAWVLSMMMAASGIPMGYEYPVPEVPFIEGAQVSTTPAPDCVPGDLQDNPYYASLLEMGVPLCPTEYDDYDPNDIPADQAAPEELPVYTEAPTDDYDDYDPSDIPADQARPDEVTEGYNYPVPENPLILPTKPLTTTTEALPTYTEDPVLEYDYYDPNDIPEDQAKPEEATEGYNYPVPENPLVLPTKTSLPECVTSGEEELGDNPYFLDQGVPICPEDIEYDEYDPSDIPEDQAKPDDLPTYTEAPVEEYDDYDPNDIPEDQAAPTGYNYPVPENPLQLPSRARKAKLVVTDEEEQVTIGLTLLDTDTYDPGNYDHNSPDYLEEVDDEEEVDGEGGEVIRQGGVSLTGPGHVISLHVPEDHFDMMKKQGVVMREDFGTKKHVDAFSSLLGGELPPPVLKGMQKNKDKQKSSKLIKSQKDSINELKSSPLGGSKRKNGEVHRRFNNGKNRKNKRTKNKNKANKHNRFDKSKSTTTTKSTSTITTSSTTTKRPRRGR